MSWNRNSSHISPALADAGCVSPTRNMPDMSSSDCLASPDDTSTKYATNHGSRTLGVRGKTGDVARARDSGSDRGAEPKANSLFCRDSATTSWRKRPARSSSPVFQRPPNPTWSGECWRGRTTLGVALGKRSLLAGAGAGWVSGGAMRLRGMPRLRELRSEFQDA